MCFLKKKNMDTCYTVLSKILVVAVVVTGTAWKCSFSPLSLWFLFSLSVDPFYSCSISLFQDQKIASAGLVLMIFESPLTFYLFVSLLLFVKKIILGSSSSSSSGTFASFLSLIFSFWGGFCITVKYLRH